MRVVQELPRDCEYSVEIEAFLSCCEAHPINDYDLFEEFCRNPYSFISRHSDFEIFRNFVNEFFKDLCNRLVDPKVRKKSLERRRSADKNFRQYADYVQKLFDTCSRQVVVRVDLCFHKGIQINLIDTRKKIAHFFANRRHNNKFRHLLGYILKTEYGIEKGIHFHAMLFFDGSKRNNNSDSFIAEEIGNYWTDVITKGQGYSWNCNRNKNQYKLLGKLGIGIIHTENKQEMANLLGIVKYLCKKEQFIKLKTRKKMKLIYRGKLPKQHIRKLGAPRNSLRNAKKNYDSERRADDLRILPIGRFDSLEVRA